MKLTNKQLKQMIKEELSAVLDEINIKPMTPMVHKMALLDKAINDPQVDEKIKNLLRMDDPVLRRQGMEFLVTLYPEDYPEDLVFKGDPGYEDEEYFSSKDEIDTYNLNSAHMNRIDRIRSREDLIPSQSLDSQKRQLKNFKFGHDSAGGPKIKPKSQRLYRQDPYGVYPPGGRRTRKIYETDK